MERERFASLQDVVLRFPAATDDEAGAEALLDLAHARLLARVPSIPARVSSGRLDPELVRGVLVDMVVRVLSAAGADGRESFQVQAGSFNIGGKYAPGANKVMVLDSDLIGLLPRGGSGFGTIRLRPTYGTR